MNTRKFLPVTLVLASALALPLATLPAHAYQGKVTNPPASERRADREEDIEVVLRTAASLQKTAQAKQAIMNSRAANSYAQADRLFTMMFQVAQREDLTRNNTIAAGSISANDASTGIATLSNASKDPVFRAESSTLRQLATLFASGTRAFLAGESQSAFGTAADEEQWLNNQPDVPAEIVVPPVAPPYAQPQVIETAPGTRVVTSPYGGSTFTINNGFYSPYSPLYDNGLWNNGFVLNNGGWNSGLVVNNGVVSSFSNPTLQTVNGYWFPSWGNTVQVIP